MAFEIRCVRVLWAGLFLSSGVLGAGVLNAGCTPAVAAVFASDAPSAARADRYPTTMSEGVYGGARLEPGIAPSVGYDLDIYLTGNRLVSLGASMHASFLGTDDGRESGREQRYLIAVDALRLKVALTDAPIGVRPYVLAGGGFYHADLPEQSTPSTVLLSDGSESTATILFDPYSEFGGLMTLGAGVDLYASDNIAFSLQLAGRVRLVGDERIPGFWADAAFGLRYGI